MDQSWIVCHYGVLGIRFPARHGRRQWTHAEGNILDDRRRGADRLLRNHGVSGIRHVSFVLDYALEHGTNAACQFDLCAT